MPRKVNRREFVKSSVIAPAAIAGVQTPDNNPEESGIGYGGLPNADGVVQLDSCCMDGASHATWA